MFFFPQAGADSIPRCVLAAPSTIGLSTGYFHSLTLGVSAARVQQISPPVHTGHAGNQILLSPGETVHVNKSYSGGLQAEPAPVWWNATKLPRGGAPGARFNARQSLKSPWLQRGHSHLPT